MEITPTLELGDQEAVRMQAAIARCITVSMIWRRR